MLLPSRYRLVYGKRRFAFQSPVLFRAIAMLAAIQLLGSFGSASEPPGWRLAWEDEFAGTELDLSEWEPVTVRHSHNNEKQYYLPEQISVADGKLRITAMDEPLEDRQYRSGRLWTRKQWRSGRFEARIKLPTTKGMWPAFWLVPRHERWPYGGEVDIVEGRGSDRYLASSAYHWGVLWREHQFINHRYHAKDSEGVAIDFHQEFHVYAAEWEPTEIRFFVDGKNHLTVTDKQAPILATPKSIVLNLAVGGDFDGDPDKSTEFPQVMIVDYVRVWQRERKPE